jgi:hypothetical protein
VKMFKKLFSSKRETKVSSNWNDFRFPCDIMKPDSVGVFSSRDISDVWLSVYMARALQGAYPGTPIHFVVHQDVHEIAEFLPFTPEFHLYGSDPGFPDPALPGQVLYFSANPGDDFLRFIEKANPLACVSCMEHPSVNIRVKTDATAYLDMIHSIMSVLDLTPPQDWKPAVPRLLAGKAAAILSPVSHRTLPYILATEAAAAILDKKRAEIPLKIVITDGRNSGIPSETGMGIIAAIVAAASAVVTTDRDLWIHAQALGVPAIGIDRKGTFKGWGSEPAAGETQFIEQWASLIRRGW